MTPEVHSHSESQQHMRLLVIGALGVVYGDIGTSPLYALRECFAPEHGLALTENNVLGILSMIFWALLVVITIKYMAFVLRADNRGEGGILALMALAATATGGSRAVRSSAIVIAGLFGAALLYGDGMITPAISVLSAVEGLNVATNYFDPYIIPITVAILLILFLPQRLGTGRIGAVFGPVILVWFAAIALLGLGEIVHNPAVLYAMNPIYALDTLTHNRIAGFLILGSVFLSVTGGEALYADMGHFGKVPIQWGWFGVALPSLLLNYFGQGALLIGDPKSVDNPFYALAPRWLLIPLVVLAAAATIIASQAVISGAFSVTRQAVLLGFFPRTRIVHTSSKEIGQIYVPSINSLLLVATIALVLGFRTSSNLASAYGVAVTSTMLITSLLLYIVERHQWHWGRPRALLLTAAFLSFDLAFFSATMTKVSHGGWFPLLVAGVLFLLMTTWRRGRSLLYERMSDRMLPLNLFVESLKQESHPPLRVPGTALYMSASDGTPVVMLHNLRYNKILHETVVIFTAVFEEVPDVPLSERVIAEDLGLGVWRVRARYGFMESPDMRQALELCAPQGLHVEYAGTGFFLSRETIIVSERPGMSRWRKRLFALLSRNAEGATAFFDLPPNQVVELGMQVEL